jgi:hypothetical protein
MAIGINLCTGRGKYFWHWLILPRSWYLYFKPICGVLGNPSLMIKSHPLTRNTATLECFCWVIPPIFSMSVLSHQDCWFVSPTCLASVSFFLFSLPHTCLFHLTHVFWVPSACKEMYWKAFRVECEHSRKDGLTVWQGLANLTLRLGSKYLGFVGHRSLLQLCSYLWQYVKQWCKSCVPVRA